MVEGARLESVYAGDRIVGSNPILSATLLNSKEDELIAIVYALNGFTKGAIEFAGSNNIELRSIRNELMN